MPWDPNKIIKYGAHLHLKPMYLRYKGFWTGKPYQSFNTHWKLFLKEKYPEKFDEENLIFEIDTEELKEKIDQDYYNMFGKHLFKSNT